MSTDILCFNTTETRLRIEGEQKRQWDIWLLSAVFVLIGLGLVMIYSASAIKGVRELGNEFYYVRSQLLKVSLGIVALFVGLRIDYRWYRRLIKPITLFSIFALVAVLFVGNNLNGSQRWFSIMGFSFQPAEIAKIVWVMYLSASVTEKGEKMRTFRYGYISHLGVLVVFIALLMKQPDFGSSIILTLTFIMFLFVSGGKIRWLFLFGLAMIPLAYQAITSRAYRMERVMAWINPWEYSRGIGYQISESLIAIGSGGLFGKGLGNGMGKLGYVPEAWNDFIGTIIAEELGLLGVGFVVLLFLFILWRGWGIAVASKDTYGKYLAFGLTALFCFQASANLCVITGIVPTKGLTLPFVSLGGSSLIIGLFSVGVLLNISKNAPDRWEEDADKRLRNSARKEYERSRRAVEKQKAKRSFNQ